MSFPSPDDFIDIHNHDGEPSPGIFSVETLMAHERRKPGQCMGIGYTLGIHPWHLDRNTFREDIEWIRTYASHENVIALGEAGYDRLRGPDINFQREAFEEQAQMSIDYSKPLFIHCVRSWDELLASHKRMRPRIPWIIHGFRGSRQLALQLTDRGMYLSFWFEYIIRPESADLIKSLPSGRIFLETDGSGTDIRNIYIKVAKDLEMEVDTLKRIIFENFRELFMN